MDSDSSTYTTASTSSRDMATQTDVEPVTSTAHSDKISSQTNLENGTSTRMSGGASSDKSVTFSPTPATSPALEKSQAEAEGFVRDKKENKEKRPGFKRNLSSLWKMLDPPELAHNTGALHNLVKAEEDNHRRKKSVDSTTLVETIASRQYKQR